MVWVLGRVGQAPKELDPKKTVKSVLLRVLFLDFFQKEEPAPLCAFFIKFPCTRQQIKLVILVTNGTFVLTFVSRCLLVRDIVHNHGKRDVEGTDTHVVGQDVQLLDIFFVQSIGDLCRSQLIDEPQHDGQVFFH